MASVIDQVMVKLGIKAEGFSAAQSAIKGFTQGAQTQLAGLKNQIAGFFTVAAGTALVRSVAQMSDRWDDLAEQMGQSTTQVQRFDAAFSKVRLTAEDAAAAFEILTQKRREALEEGGPAAEMFKKLGISEEELRSLRTGADIFSRMSKGRSVTNQQDRELFGEMFGTKRGGKFLAGGIALENLGDINAASPESVKALADALKSFDVAMRDFKVASIPLVAALVRWADIAIRFYGGGGESDNTKRAQGLMLEAFNIQKGRKKIFGLEMGEYNFSPEQRAEAAKVREILRGDKAGFGEQSLMNVKNLSDGTLDALQRRIAEIRLGRNLPSGGPQHAIGSEFGSYQEAVDAQTGGVGVNEYSATQRAIQSKLGDAMHGVLFRAGNASTQKAILDRRMRELAAEAAAETDPLKRAGIQSDIIKTAGQRAGLSAQGELNIGADSLASVGGIVGGAGMLDPSLTVEQDQLSVLRDILGGIKELPVGIREAVEQAIRDRPIDNLGGGR